MKITRKELDEILLELEELEEPELELELGEDEPEENWERELEIRATMKRLVIAGLNGDDMAWSIWSDLWKDMYGTRPRYTEEHIRWMYGLEKKRT